MENFIFCAVKFPVTREPNSALEGNTWVRGTAKIPGKTKMESFAVKENDF